MTSSEDDLSILKSQNNQLLKEVQFLKNEIRQLESENIFQLLINQSIDAILLTTPDGKIHFANPMACNLLGRTEQEIIQVGRNGLVDLNDPNLQLLLKERSRDGSAKGELNFIHKDGHIIPTEIYSQIFKTKEGKIYTSMSIRDITIQKKAALELKKSEQWFKSLIQNSYEGIQLIDKDGIIVYESPSVKQMLGFDPEEMIGHHITEFVHWEDKDIARKALENNFRNDEFSKIIEFRILSKTGIWIWIEALITNLLKDPIVAAMVINYRNITERKEIEIEQHNLTQELITINKDLQEFTYIVSHNMRAPVANILGLLSVFNKKDFADPINEAVFQKLELGAKNIEDTIRELNEILTIKRDSHEPRKLISFSEELEYVKEIISDTIEKTNAKITSNFSLAPQIHSVKSYIKSVFYQLITNALKYKSPDRDPEILISSSREQNFVCLEIKDNGLGIDLEKAGRDVFGLYRRFHPGIPGKGLSLHLIKAQVESLGGRIELESILDHGSKFKIYLPSL